MFEPTFKVTADHYNSGTVFTGMITDGEEVTSSKNSFSAAWRELIHSIDPSEENFSLELPMDIEEEPKTASQLASLEISHAKALVLLAPSLARKEPQSIKDITEQTEPTLNEEDLAIADIFFNELRFGIREQAREHFELLLKPSFSNEGLESINGMSWSLESIREASRVTMSSISNLSIADLLRMRNPGIDHRFDLLIFRQSSFGTRMCITMALAFFSSFGCQVVLSNEKNTLKIKVCSKN